jgi:hypothetical protein
LESENVEDLKISIEKKRREMEQLAIEKGVDDVEVLQKSMELDELLNQFYLKKYLTHPRKKQISA